MQLLNPGSLSSGFPVLEKVVLRLPHLGVFLKVTKLRFILAQSVSSTPAARSTFGPPVTTLDALEKRFWSIKNTCGFASLGRVEQSKVHRYP